MNQPGYQPLQKEDIPLVQSADTKFKIQVIAGELDNTLGKIQTDSPMNIYRLDFDMDGDFNFEIPSHFNALIYVLEGQLQVGDAKVNTKEMAIFKEGMTQAHLKSITSGKAVFFAGEPLDEPVSKYGPYVMNTQTELLEAMRDYQMGKMGVLIEEFED